MVSGIILSWDCMVVFLKKMHLFRNSSYAFTNIIVWKSCGIFEYRNHYEHLNPEIFMTIWMREHQRINMPWMQCFLLLHDYVFIQRMVNGKYIIFSWGCMVVLLKKMHLFQSSSYALINIIAQKSLWTSEYGNHYEHLNADT